MDVDPRLCSVNILGMGDGHCPSNRDDSFQHPGDTRRNRDAQQMPWALLVAFSYVSFHDMWTVVRTGYRGQVLRCVRCVAASASMRIELLCP